jgi:hypothetical protein
LYTTHELADLLDPDKRMRMTPWLIAKALRRAGVELPPITRTTRGTLRLWPVKNIEKWESASHLERASHYDGVLDKKK